MPGVSPGKPEVLDNPAVGVRRLPTAAGESMEPTLPGGCVVLVDHKRKQLQPGRIFVIRTEDGIVIRRAEKDETGNWMLKSDHPGCEPEPSRGSVVIGEVRWMAKKI